MIGVILAGIGGVLTGAVIAGIVAVVAVGIGAPSGPGWLVPIVPWLAFCAWGAIQNRNR